MPYRNKEFAGLIFLIAAFACVPSTCAQAARGAAPDLNAKLARKADFVPNDESTLDRLVAIAKQYEIPMGIEWIGGVGEEDLELPAAAVPRTPTVRDLLTAIVSRLPDYQLSIENGVVHIAPPVFAVREDNFLNLLIEEFRIKNENLFGAQYYLKIAIEMTLHPKDDGGYGGGYGYGPDHVFAKRQFSYKSANLTVRQILDGLINTNGNALWIAEFDREDFVPPAKPEPEWRFEPLGEKLN